MAVPEQTPYIEHTGNGVTTSFSLGFQCESKDHLIVLVDEVEPPIATWSLTGGNVVFTTAPAAGKKITLQRNTPFGRTTDYQSFNNSFRPQTVNGDFDRLWLKLQELGVADWLLRLYVDRLHQKQEEKIDNLKIYVDDKDDELRAYLMEEIRKQGVALDQLDDYYNYLMQRLAQIAVDKGWDASFVVDGDKNQHQINEDQTALNNKFLKFKQSEAGAVEVDLSVRAKTLQYITDYATVQNAFAVKRNNSTYLKIPNGQYNIDGALPLNGSHLIEGQGDQTILKFAGAGNGIVYSAGSKFDDHAHRTIKNMRIQGDNTKSGILDAKDGMTVGYKSVATGHFGQTEGITFDGHAVGQLVQQNYTSRESYNYYRSNKVGLHLNGITSYRIESIYARYNSDAAILITGDIQNLTIDGGAIEGNRGRGIWAKDLSVANTRASININDLYMEVDGDYAAGIPAVDIQEVDNMTIAVRSGVFWLNTASGITSGIYKWGQNVSFDGTSLAGYHYAKNMSIINRGVVEVGRFSTCDSEAASRLHGLVEPVLMHKFEPREVRNALIGTPFLRGKPSSAIPFSNTAATAYPYTNEYSGGISVAEDTASDYGDGSFQSFTIPAAGNFNSNYVELTNYDSAVNPYHIFCFMLKPTQDMEIGFTQAGAQTQYSGYFKLKAGVTYKLVMTGNNTAAAINRLRMFSLESTSKTVSFKPIIKATFKNRDDCIGFINRHCLS